MRRFTTHGMMTMLLPLVAFYCLCASTAHAQADPSIIDWGSPAGHPPPYQTPDIWVDNDGDGVKNEPGEPTRGLVNQLVAQVRNLGPSPANGVQVRLSYAPYGAWGPTSDANFKEIATVSVDLGAAGTSTAERTVQRDWDLSNSLEDNGGMWGGHTLGEFDHFCVRVHIIFPVDSNTSNNMAQNNFANVEVAYSSASMMKIVLPNSKNAPAVGELVFRGLPPDWNPVVKGIDDPTSRFTLKPGEIRIITISLTPPRPERVQKIPDISARSNDLSVNQVMAGQSVPPDKRHVDVGLKLDGELVGGVSFDITAVETPTVRFAPSGGVLSPYIIGTWDLRGGRRSFLQLVNPTGRPLRVMVALFDDNEKPLKCLRDSLSPNDLLEIDIKRELREGYGVVKVVSYSEREDRPEAGVIGYQRLFVSRFFYKGLVSESPLHQIPAETLKDDLQFILRACH
jgi:hypothetical protein